MALKFNHWRFHRINGTSRLLRRRISWYRKGRGLKSEIQANRRKKDGLFCQDGCVGLSELPDKKTSIPHKGNRWLSCEKGDVPVGQWGRKQSVSEWKWKRKFSECSDFERNLLLTAFVEHQRILLEINGCEGDIFNSAHDSEQGRVLRLGPKAYSMSILSGKKWAYMTKGYLKTGPFLFI